MITKRINKAKVEIYDSIDELPIDRFMEFNKSVMIDAGIGSDLASIDKRISTIMHWNKNGHTENVAKELMNMRQTIAFVLNKQSPKMSSFICLVKSINNKPVTNLSTSGIQEAIDTISNKGVTIGFVNKMLSFVKKKLMRS